MTAPPPASPPSNSLQRRLADQLDPTMRRKGLSPLNTLLLAMILAAVALACLETEDTLQKTGARFFQIAEYIFGGMFLAEYAARLWTAPCRDPSEPAWRERLKFIFSPASVLDLLAVSVSFLTPVGMSPFALRLLRLTRVLRLAKLARLSRATSYFTRAIVARRDELYFSVIVGLVFLVGSATILYAVEGPSQPDKFGSIPRALWWAVATLTTIGYGDVYPETPIGKICAGVCAIVGIGLVAVPTGIMAAAFTEAHEQQREEDRRKHELGLDAEAEIPLAI